MSKTKFTPGPWKHTEALPRLVEASVPLRRNGWKVPTTVCQLGEGNGWCKERAWNAYLIAAAPEMYEILAHHLELIKKANDGDTVSEQKIFEQAADIEKVLKKARGEK